MIEIPLREYQDNAVAETRVAIRADKKRPLVVSPTGSGKTRIACRLIRNARVKDKRCMFIVDSIPLIDQTSEVFDSFRIEHGVMQANHWRRRPHSPVQLCTAQTLESRGIPGDVDLIIIDEAHCQRKKIIEHIMLTDAVVVGLTATPFTKGLGRVYNAVINVATMNSLIEQGFLSPLRVYVAKQINTKGMKTVAGEWSPDDIRDRGREIIGDIVSEWEAKTAEHFGGPAKTLVYSASIDHGADLCKQFNAAGYVFHQLSYKDNDETKKAIIDEFRKPDSAIHGLISCEILTKGFDCIDVKVGISARPYRKSLSQHIQQLGRVMRIAPGKDFALWLDHSGNFARFYKSVEDVFENGVGSLDSLEKHADSVHKEPTAKEVKEMKCSCGAVLSPGQMKCPACGREKVRHSLVENVPGQMVAVTMGKKANKEWDWDRKASFVSGLREYAARRGYKDGWVSHQYAAKFGVPMTDPRVRNAVAAPPTPETLSWIRSRLIAFAKAKRAA